VRKPEKAALPKNPKELITETRTGGKKNRTLDLQLSMLIVEFLFNEKSPGEGKKSWLLKKK